jgi:hypothetical protein
VALGIGDLNELAAIVLETDGTLSVITASQIGDGSSLQGVCGASLERPNTELELGHAATASAAPTITTAS